MYMYKTLQPLPFVKMYHFLKSCALYICAHSLCCVPKQNLKKNMNIFYINYYNVEMKKTFHNSTDFTGILYIVCNN